jgi:uncharacterized membrane protein YkvI
MHSTEVVLEDLMNSYSETFGFEGKASSGLWLAAMVSYIVHVIVSVVSMAPSSSRDAASEVGSFIGTLIGALIWPLIVVGIASFWESNRNQRRRVMVFSIASVVFVVLRFAAILAIVAVRSRTGG